MTRWAYGRKVAAFWASWGGLQWAISSFLSEHLCPWVTRWRACSGNEREEDRTQDWVWAAVEGLVISFGSMVFSYCSRFYCSSFICVFLSFLINPSEKCIFNSQGACVPVRVCNEYQAFSDSSSQSISYSKLCSHTCSRRWLNRRKPHFPLQKVCKFSSCWVLCNKISDRFCHMAACCQGHRPIQHGLLLRNSSSLKDKAVSSLQGHCYLAPL